MILTDAQRSLLSDFIELQMNFALQVDTIEERDELLLRLMQLVNSQGNYPISNKQEEDFYALVESYFENPNRILDNSGTEITFQETPILQIIFRISALKYLNNFVKENKGKSALPNELTQDWINNSAIILKDELKDLTETIEMFFEAEVESIKNKIKSLTIKKRLSLIPIIAGSLYLTATVISSYFITPPTVIILSSIFIFDVSLCITGCTFFEYYTRALDEPANSIKNSSIKKYLETEDINKMSMTDLEENVRAYLNKIDEKIKAEIKILDEFLPKESYKNVVETLDSSKSLSKNSKAEQTLVEKVSTMRKRTVMPSPLGGEPPIDGEVRIIIPDEPRYPNYPMLP